MPHRLSATIRAVALPLSVSALIAACEGAAPAPAPAAGFYKQNDAAMTAMMSDMHVSMTGDVDADFLRMMIPHHQGAIDMAEAQLRYGRDDGVKQLSRAIIAKQREEIAAMRQMLAAAPAAPTAVPGHHHGAAPGGE